MFIFIYADSSYLNFCIQIEQEGRAVFLLSFSVTYSCHGPEDTFKPLKNDLIRHVRL